MTDPNEKAALDALAQARRDRVRAIAKALTDMDYASGMFGIGIGGVGRFLAQVLLRPERYDPQLVESKLRAAAEALEEANQYVQSTQLALKDQQKQIIAAQASYEHYRQLNATQKEQAQAFVAEMAAVISTSTRKERVWAFVINIIAGLILFIFGVVASDWAKEGWVRFLALF
jgi:hypothetical protein